ncbi:hypothetical protein FACS189421_12320 [Bacteroidia bacterium]|nr:hypothetical protein FACS189421_12320 [Bacteroidia bacterium]
MNQILIVSKTKMSKNHVCIGGIDLDNKLSVRLLNKDGYHESMDECPYNIREIWQIQYTKSYNPRPLPHSEDICVVNKKQRGILKDELSMLDALKQVNFKIYNGSIRDTFEKKLKNTTSGTFYISEDDVPQNSTCFWICDRDIARRDSFGKIKYRYQDETRQWGYDISFVGLDTNPIQIIPRGTLVRLSLANWWSPQDSAGEKRCYLQLSGWYDLN